jgi:hypothetical protein
MKAPENNQLTPPAIRTPEQGRPAQAVPPGAKPAPDKRRDGIPEDIRRAGEMLAGHSLKTVRQIAEEEKISGDGFVAMIDNMVAAHRFAAATLERAGLSAKLKLREARQ